MYVCPNASFGIFKALLRAPGNTLTAKITGAFDRAELGITEKLSRSLGTRTETRINSYQI